MRVLPKSPLAHRRHIGSWAWKPCNNSEPLTSIDSAPYCTFSPMCMSSSCQDSTEQSTDPSSTRRLMNRKTQGSYWGLSQRFPGRSRKLQNSGSCNEKGTEIDLGNHEYEFSCRLPSNCRVEYSRSNLT